MTNAREWVQRVNCHILDVAANIGARCEVLLGSYRYRFVAMQNKNRLAV